MKRISKLLCLACAGALVLQLAGCSFFQKDGADANAESGVSIYGKVSDFDYENFDYSAGLDENGYWSGVKALDHVKLPEDAAAIPVPKAEVQPTSEEIQAEIDNLLRMNAATTQVTNRAAANGDTVNIDYTGTVDGVVFNGGAAAGYDLTLGSGSFIDGFEDQVVGHTPGETFDVKVTFPDGYGDTTDAEGNTMTLSNQKAVFSVTLNYISETVLPTLNDEWVDASFGATDDIHTVADLEALCSELLTDANIKDYVMDYLMKNSEFKALPEVITDYQVNQCLNYYNTMAKYYGYGLEDFVKETAGYENADALLASMDANLERYSQEALLYQAVAESLSVTPTQEQLDRYSSYNEVYGENYCRMVALMDAVSETLRTGAVLS
ncbi:MAG: FKBP-type peptidyl-prolyl cis-trans isomerase [Faecalibacterium sp.]